ncbi:hypothetical protein EFL69_04470 [Weissella confusa]|uniref:hypothetical protein n=1 Tax=Weissella confusa TaxID=1583 RepID=UPI00223BCC8C|nr:hypothetical protein [Weissella confusa]MCS9992356.1 hypothetical protein [Weissella confusa]
MTIEMRELRGDDLFTMLNIVSKLGIKDEFVTLFDEAANEAKEGQLDQNIMGMKVMTSIVQAVLANLGTVKNELNGLLGDVAGMTAQEVSDLSFTDYTKLVMDFFKKPELTDFFKSIASLLN